MSASASAEPPGEPAPPASAAENVYQRGVAGEAEGARLAALTVPDEFSSQVLGSVRGKTVLDVGAGTSTRLGRWIADPAQGGRYAVMDPWERAQAAHEAAGHVVLRAAADPSGATGCSVTDLAAELSIADGQFDVSHARFVLCHVPAQLRPQAIRGLLRVSRERVVIIEHVGATLGGSVAVNEFKRVLRAIENDDSIPFSTFYEEHLWDEVQTAVAGIDARVELRRLGRPPGLHHDELVTGATRLMLPMLAERPALERDMASVIEALKREQRYVAGQLRTGAPPTPISMPDLEAVVVSVSR